MSVLRAMAESATLAAWLAAERAAFFCCLAEYMVAPTEAAEPTSAAVAPMIAAVPILSYDLRSMIYEVSGFESALRAAFYAETGELRVFGGGAPVTDLFCGAADVVGEHGVADGGEGAAEELPVGGSGVDFGDAGVVVAHDLREFEGVVSFFTEPVRLCAGVLVLNGIGFSGVVYGFFEDLSGGYFVAKFGAGGGVEAGGSVV